MYAGCVLVTRVARSSAERRGPARSGAEPRRASRSAAQSGKETLETHPQSVMGSEGLAQGTVGCLVVYCAGCALKIEDRLQKVAQAFSYSLERPFVGMFPYGEQFRNRAGANQHANLMYAVLAFGD